jgi:hypothetical protein
LYNKKFEVTHVCYVTYMNILLENVQMIWPWPAFKRNIRLTRDAPKNEHYTGDLTTRNVGQVLEELNMYETYNKSSCRKNNPLAFKINNIT